MTDDLSTVQKVHYNVDYREGNLVSASADWKPSHLVLFRFVFVFFLLQALPLDWKYYRFLFSIEWSNVHMRDLFYLAKYTPQFTWEYSNTLTVGIQQISDWLILLIISAVIAWGWSVKDRSRKEYNDLYYILRVILRYRLAFGIAAYGFIKFFPVQQPYPSLSLMNTNYGDLSDWKIAALTYGVAPSFEAFLGAIEILAALLLLHRKTASIGAAIVVGFTGNVLLSILGYNGGEALYCLYLLGFASVILFYDGLRYYNLLILAKPTAPDRYEPEIFHGRLNTLRVALKILFFIFTFVLYGYLSFAAYNNNEYQYPTASGLKDVAGMYNVREFRLNGKILPYAHTDSVRWQNVVFEKWPTLSIASNREIIPDLSNTEEIYLNDLDKNFESTGSSGRSFYRYDVDSLAHTLRLYNKNPHYAKEQLVFNYSRTGKDEMVLRGFNENKDSIYVVLERIPKIYLLDESYKLPKNRSAFE